MKNHSTAFAHHHYEKENLESIQDHRLWVAAIASHQVNVLSCRWPRKIGEKVGRSFVQKGR